MNPLIRIRTQVFDASQSEMAAIAGVSQATISRWETGAGAPDLAALDRIRGEAIRRNLDWNDRWFFEAPPPGITEAAE
jgi:transcriptional regulator with XRE-family HTH domain